MRKVILVLVAILALATLGVRGLAGFETKGIPPSACLQDQYGGKYNFTVDLEHNYLYGEYITAQPCDAEIWHLTGSFARTSEGWMIELTAANPLGDNDTGCVPTFKVKGVYPNAAWYYTWGYGGQEFTWTHWGAPITEDVEQGGILR